MAKAHVMVFLSQKPSTEHGRFCVAVLVSACVANIAPRLTKVLREEWGAAHVLVVSDGPDCIGALCDGFHAAATHEAPALVRHTKLPLNNTCNIWRVLF